MFRLASFAFCLSAGSQGGVKQYRTHQRQEKAMKRISNLLLEIGSSMLIFVFLFPQPSMAEDVVNSSYEIVVIGNRAFGNLVVSGDYREAIKRISGTVDRHHPFSAPNNLCVVYTAIGQYEAALPFCDKAIEVAEWKSRPGPGRLKDRVQMVTIAALAHSNRGVARVLSGDEAGGEDDFQAAIELKNDMRAPLRNFARMSIGSSEPVAVIIRSR